MTRLSRSFDVSFIRSSVQRLCYGVHAYSASYFNDVLSNLQNKAHTSGHCNYMHTYIHTQTILNTLSYFHFLIIKGHSGIAVLAPYGNPRGLHLHIMCFLTRVFRTMFKEFKPSAGANRLSSPLLRRRIPTISHQYMSPQNTRKSRIPGIGRMKKKRSVPEGLARVDSPESSAMPAAPFCEDPRNLQIKEQVSLKSS